MLQTLILTLCVGFFASCESLRLEKEEVAPIPAERKQLQRAALAPDAVVFDAIIAHVPYNDRELAKELWKDVDEQELAPSSRRALNEQGFRVGLIGAAPPDSLTKILSLKGRGLRSSVLEEIDYSRTESTLDPISYSKPVNLREGMKSAVEMRDELIPSIPILERDRDGSLCGKTYANASPIFCIAIKRSQDGSVLFDVAPLLRYGAPQSVTRYRHGQLVRAQERPTKSFDSLRFSLALRPGQFLVIGATDSRTNALGKYFFSDGGEDFEQTFLVLRLLVTQHDEQFDRFSDFNELITSDAQNRDSDVLDGEDEVVVKFEREDRRKEEGFADYELDADHVETTDDPPLDAMKEDDEPNEEPSDEIELTDE